MVPYIAREEQSQESQDEENAREEFEVESLLTGRWVELLTALFIGTVLALPPSHTCDVLGSSKLPPT